MALIRVWYPLPFFLSHSTTSWSTRIVRRSLGSGMVSFAAFQNDLPSLGISESSMSASRIARKRLKSVLPLVRAPEVLCVILPFIAMCPPCRNNPPPFAAHYIDHYDFNVFHKTNSEDAVFTVTALHSLEHRPVKIRLAS